MSVCRKLPDGTVQKIAGHTILLDANAAEIRQGTGHLTMRPDAQFLDSTVTFSDPMPDTDYAVDISFTTEWGISALARVQQKTVTGFKLEGYVTNSIDAAQYGANGWDFKYIAWKPIKLDGYTALQNKVNSPDDTPTKDSMNLVTSGGVYEAIKNASAVWEGTKAAWNALPAADKMKYDLAVLLDATLVKAVDREDGTETDVANLNKIWRGTKAEWEALSATEKAKYDQAEVIDEYTGVPVVVDKVEAGNLNPVTSNAVAKALNVTPETITPTPVTGGAAGTISWESFNVKKLGKLVNITINDMRHTNDISTPGHMAIVTGLPKPALGRIYLAGLNYGDNGNSACAYIDADGNLGIDSGFSLAGSKLYGSVCYMSV